MNCRTLISNLIRSVVLKINCMYNVNFTRFLKGTVQAKAYSSYKWEPPLSAFIFIGTCFYYTCLFLFILSIKKFD